MMFIYKITEVKFCMSLSKYQDVIVATSDAAAYTTHRKLILTAILLKNSQINLKIICIQKIEKTRIEPVGKPYREVCLQTLLWPWKVHRPSSWSLLLSELAFKLKVCFFLFFFKWLFWVVLNIPSTNELKKKKKKKVGYFWDLIQGPLNLASDALPTELRGLSLQGNS